MATFPAPHLERRTFQTLPDEGTLLTEPALLQLLYDLLRPLNAITYAFVIAEEEMSAGEDSQFLLQFIEEIQEQAVLLLRAWHDHQTAEEDEDDADNAAEEEDAPAAAPPARRRPRRSQPPRPGEGA